MMDQRDTFTGSSGEGKEMAAENATHAVSATEDGSLGCGARLNAVIRRFHGEVGSPLAAVGLRLELIRGNPSLDRESAAALDMVSAELAAVIDCVRESVAELRDLERESAMRKLL